MLLRVFQHSQDVAIRALCYHILHNLLSPLQARYIQVADYIRGRA